MPLQLKSRLLAMPASCWSREQSENAYSLRVAFVERLFRSEEQNLAQALTTARNNAQSSILEEEKEAQAALKVRDPASSSRGVREGASVGGSCDGGREGGRKGLTTGGASSV